MGKRVYCLYRVSTKGQVEKDDIPMQKQRCHEFAEEKGWDIVRELYEIEVNPDEKVVIHEIFDLAERYGYGGRRISSELKAKGIINTRTGEPFHYASIQNILKNIMYLGILRSGETQSEIFPELQIITPEQFERVEKGRQQRSAEYERKCANAYQEEIVLADGIEVEVNRPPRICPKRNSGKALLSGNVYCGHCGGRIFATTARKSHHPTSAEVSERVPIYKCYNRTQHKEYCSDPTTYSASRVDEIVKSILHGIFERSKAVNEKNFIEQQIQSSTQQYQQKLRKAKADYSKAEKELIKWESLMLDSIEGICPFTPD